MVPMTTDAFEPPLTDDALDPSAPVVVKIQEPGDLLAMVGHTLGYTPTRSLVLIGLHGTRTGAHLRLDLSPAAEDPVALAVAAARYLSGPDVPSPPAAVVALLYVDHAPAPPRHDDPWMRPYAGLCEALRSVFEGSLGIDVFQIWQVGGGYARDYDCLDAACCPFPGTPVGSASGSLVDTHMVYQGSMIAHTPEEIAEEMLLPHQAVDPSLSTSIRRELQMLRSRETPPAPEDALPLWEVALESCPSVEDLAAVEQWLAENVDVVALILRSLQHNTVRDAVLVLAAQDLRTAQSAGELFRQTLTGSTGSAPRWDRMERASVLCRVLLALGDRYSGPELLSMVSWIEWAKGRGAVAGVLLDRVIAAAPGHQLTELLSTAVNTGMICPWARVTAQSWSEYSRTSSAP